MSKRGVSRSSMPVKPPTNLNSLLHDIYVRYIAFNDKVFERYYRVVDDIIYHQLHCALQRANRYYGKYSSDIKFAGSHPDKLRIKKPDEFDIDIVIGLPLNIHEDPYNPAESDFILEPQAPGFVQLKVGVQFDRLPIRDGAELENNRAAYRWRDKRNYLLRFNFMNWFKRVVHRALNEFRSTANSVPIFEVDGVRYKVSLSESGPAVTLYLVNVEENFQLDVDLVPALKFPVDRWPICRDYRPIPEWHQYKLRNHRHSSNNNQRMNNYWLVVPKPNKDASEVARKRSWRVAMHEQERMLLHDKMHMKQAIRFMKKFRDAQNMGKIASYYIKTLFFWEVMDQDWEFWNNNPAYLFEHMLGKFHNCLVNRQILYFWNKGHNFLDNIDEATLEIYARKVNKLVDVFKKVHRKPNEYTKVARFLLNKNEFMEYNYYVLRKAR